MKQITEDYVSYEISKLLDEKGFDCQYFNGYYNEAGCVVDIPNYLIEGKYYKRPTHQVARKWLRIVHNIDIEIRHGFKSVEYIPWVVNAKDGGMINGKGGRLVSIGFDEPEQALETAILYVLKNLI